MMNIVEPEKYAKSILPKFTQRIIEIFHLFSTGFRLKVLKTLDFPPKNGTMRVQTVENSVENVDKPAFLHGFPGQSKNSPWYRFQLSNGKKFRYRHAGAEPKSVFTGIFPPILRQPRSTYASMPSFGFLVLTKICSVKTALHLTANEFEVIFVS